MKARPMMMGMALSFVATLAVAGDDSARGASGQGPVTGSEERPAVPAAKNLNPRPGYWTPERYRNARPMPLPSGDDALPQAMPDEAPGNRIDPMPAAGESRSGQPPLLDAPEREPLEKRLYVPDESRSDNAGPQATAPTQQRAKTTAIPLDVGVGRAYFSSQPLVPVAADREYPYAAIGQLFFTIPGEGGFACSGTVVSPRLVLTAGHCVHSGANGEQGWFADFEFVPAYRDGVAPFSNWKASAAFVTGPWYNGKGNVPNSADYALLEMDDQLVGGVSRRIGEVVGFLGYQTNSLNPNHAHLIGYPSAFDNGERMHQVTAQSYRGDRRYNTVLYGSDMNEGSSGGPWIMNFGPAAAGQTGADDPARNRIIGVTSYGFQTTELQGSSTLDGNFTSLLNKGCARRDGTC